MVDNKEEAEITIIEVNNLFAFAIYDLRTKDGNVGVDRSYYQYENRKVQRKVTESDQAENWNYTETTCDTSVSPDGKNELKLQAVGEPDWPFGSANGQLILKEGKDKISQTGFKLRNDGGSIHSSCWKVT